MTGTCQEKSSFRMTLEKAGILIKTDQGLMAAQSAVWLAVDTLVKELFPELSASVLVADRQKFV